MADSKSIREQARAEVEKELADKAKEGLKTLYRRRAAAVEVLAGIDREIEVAEAAITAGG